MPAVAETPAEPVPVPPDPAPPVPAGRVAVAPAIDFIADPSVFADGAGVSVQANSRRLTATGRTDDRMST
jgi:hypothetical protein